MPRLTLNMICVSAASQYVINYAGFGLLGRAYERNQAEQLAMIDLNMRVLTDSMVAASKRRMHHADPG